MQWVGQPGAVAVRPSSLGGETLEERALLTYSATLTDGVVTFTGDSAADTLEFTTDGNGFLQHNRFSQGDSGFNSDIDLVSGDGANDTTLAVAAVTQLAVDAGAKADIVTLTAGLTGMTGAITIDGETDGDTVNLNADVTFDSDNSLLAARRVHNDRSRRGHHDFGGRFHHAHGRRRRDQRHQHAGFREHCNTRNADGVARSTLARRPLGNSA